MDLTQLSILIFLLLIACFVAIIVHRIKLPYTIALVLVGLGICLTNLAPHITISHDVIFTLVLPPLLFYGAMHMDLEDLFGSRMLISTLAILGVLVSTMLIGFMMHHFMGFDLLPALLFGALITPTDPISVLAILKKVDSPKRLNVILEGESLFNDGTGAVLFLIILSLITSGAQFDVGHSLIEFIKVTGGGTVVGFVFGYITYRILLGMEDPDLGTALTVVLALGVPFIAESFHFSGIIAVVVAGLTLGNFGKVLKLHAHFRVTFNNFWKVVEFMINSILFLVIGMELQEITRHDWIMLWPTILGAIVVLLVARALVIYPTVWVRNKLCDNDIPLWWGHILCWGGLKGSISIALAVGLPESFPLRHEFLVLAFAIVLFTLLVQGLTIQPLVKMCTKK